MTARIALFDLGAVVLHWEPARLYRNVMSAKEADAFCRDICTMEWHTQHDAGVSMAQNASDLIAQHPDKADLIRMWDTGWMEMFHGYVEGTCNLIAALKSRDVPVYALTNFPAEKWDETAAAFPVLNGFEDVIISGVEKLIKPDPAIYTLTLERMGSPHPSEVFFIDDRDDNIRAAQGMGMQGHVFTNAVSLERALEDCGLL